MWIHVRCNLCAIFEMVNSLSFKKLMTLKAPIGVLLANPVNMVKLYACIYIDIYIYILFTKSADSVTN